jgi:hypothetical protein
MNQNTNDVVVRTRIEQPEQTELPKPTGKEIVTPKEDGVEVPFTDYELTKHKPYTADYFDIGPLWEDKVGGFKPEMLEIENYITNKIKQGQIDNTVKAVKEFYKKVEKLSGIDKTERTVVRIAKMAAYIKFMNESDGINKNNTKYG